MSDRLNNRSSDRLSDKSPEAIRAEIEETREKLSEDLDELSYRFSPEGLKDRASETLESAQDVFTGATQGVVDSLGERVEGLSRSLLGRIKDNPLPATLLGAGLSWLLMQGSQGDSSGRENRYGNSYGRAASYVSDPQRTGGAVLDGSGDLVYRTPSQKAGGAKPLLLGAGVLVAGLAVGLLIPNRRDRTGGANRGLASNAGVAVGDVGRNLQSAVQKTVRETADDAKRAVNEAREGSSETTRNQTTRSAYDFDADRDYYRTHHGDTYTDTDFSYEDFEPAYRYGAGLGGEGDGTWDDAREAEVRSRWEREQRASWDTFGGAVRRGFERARGR